MPAFVKCLFPLPEVMALHLFFLSLCFFFESRFKLLLSWSVLTSGGQESLAHLGSLHLHCERLPGDCMAESSFTLKAPQVSLQIVSEV